ncbi:DUF6660 family protein [Pedobacter punctiformis]|uniref:Uncharacterized protein n=1 Tax=Pedobacter punctiformis TaxID=3004097 RepID=A0ABT4L850_9SPHI|nr:DUF6660 family protein [Pedobacter sp. HCMS5-2]MCZ4244093.1 hypothetical protein [Pedobacter sp. HCMS5-2]
MRCSIIIFSVYLILLGLLPCQDRADLVVSAQYSTSVQHADSGTKHAQDESCPPFCSCACCSVGQHFPIDQTSAEIELLHYTSYQVFCISNIKKQPVDVWQPPKLA